LDFGRVLEASGVASREREREREREVLEVLVGFLSQVRWWEKERTGRRRRKNGRRGEGEGGGAARGAQV